jgi:hypothetical protein
MSKLIQRLKCQHYFIEGDLVQGWPDPKRQFDCVDCGKTVVRRPSEAPLNPLRETNQQYYERMVASGRADQVMRPILGTEHEAKL